MFPIRPPMAPKWRILKIVGLCSNTCFRLFKSTQKVWTWKPVWTLKIRFYRAIWVWGENIEKIIRHGGLKTPNGLS